MRTTIDLPEALLRQLKAQAALEGTSLKQLVLALVERGLQSPAVSPASLRSRSPLPKLMLDQPLSVKQFSNATCSNCWELVTFDRDFDRFEGLDCLRLNAASH